MEAEKRHKGKVLGGRFIDGLENPADAQDLSARVVVGENDVEHRGAAFLISQKFIHDWTKLNAMSELQKQSILHVLAMRQVLTPEQAARFDDTVVKALTEDPS